MFPTLMARILLLLLACLALSGAKSQIVSNTFFDSIFQHSSPVPAELARHHQLRQTHVIGIRIEKKKRDTVLQRIVYYDGAGRSLNAIQINNRYGDTTRFSFRYDTLGRMRRVESTGRFKRETFIRYEGDSLRIEENYFNGRKLGSQVQRFNQQQQLLALTTFDQKGGFVYSIQYSYNDAGLPEYVVQHNSNGKLAENQYQHQTTKQTRQVLIYDIGAGYKRMVEKREYNAAGWLIRRTTYDYYYRNKEFTETYEYSKQGLLLKSSGLYHYSGRRFLNIYIHE